MVCYNAPAVRCRLAGCASCTRHGLIGTAFAAPLIGAVFFFYLE